MWNQSAGSPQVPACTAAQQLLQQRSLWHGRVSALTGMAGVIERSGTLSHFCGAATGLLRRASADPTFRLNCEMPCALPPAPARPAIATGEIPSFGPCIGCRPFLTPALGQIFALSHSATVTRHGYRWGLIQVSRSLDTCPAQPRVSTQLAGVNLVATAHQGSMYGVSM